jgi:hypothetical protein
MSQSHTIERVFPDLNEKIQFMKRILFKMYTTWLPPRSEILRRANFLRDLESTDDNDFHNFRVCLQMMHDTLSKDLTALVTVRSFENRWCSAYEAWKEFSGVWSSKQDVAPIPRSVSSYVALFNFIVHRFDDGIPWVMKYENDVWHVRDGRGWHEISKINPMLERIYVSKHAKIGLMLWTCGQVHVLCDAEFDVAHPLDENHRRGAHHGAVIALYKFYKAVHAMLRTVSVMNGNMQPVLKRANEVTDEEVAAFQEIWHVEAWRSWIAIPAYFTDGNFQKDVDVEHISEIKSCVLMLKRMVEELHDWRAWIVSRSDDDNEWYLRKVTDENPMEAEVDVPEPDFENPHAEEDAEEDVEGRLAALHALGV